MTLLARVVTTAPVSMGMPNVRVAHASSYALVTYKESINICELITRKS